MPPGVTNYVPSTRPCACMCVVTLRHVCYANVTLLIKTELLDVLYIYHCHHLQVFATTRSRVRMTSQRESQKLKGNFSFPPDQVEGNTDCFVVNRNPIAFVHWENCFVVRSNVHLKLVVRCLTAPKKKYIVQYSEEK